MVDILRNVKQVTSGFRSSKWFIAFVVSYAIFVDQFIFTSVIPLAPQMMRRFGVPEEDLSHMSSYLLSSCGVSMLIMSRGSLHGTYSWPGMLTSHSDPGMVG